MAKLLRIENNDGDTVGYMYFCPGCKSHHAPYISPHKSPNGSSWKFSGDEEKPTFSPSILTRVNRSDGKLMICHSFIVYGNIQYLDDCTHELAGQTVPIPEDD
jgi:hypothetical protein